MTRDVKMDAQLGVSKEGYAGRTEVLAGPTGRQRRSRRRRRGLPPRVWRRALWPPISRADTGRPAGRYTIGVAAFGAIA